MGASHQALLMVGGGGGGGTTVLWDYAGASTECVPHNGMSTDLFVDLNGSGSGKQPSIIAILSRNSGKYGFEINYAAGTQTFGIFVGLTDVTVTPGNGDRLAAALNSYAYWAFNGNKYTNATSTAYGTSYGAPTDFVQCVYDVGAGGTITFYKNGVSQGVAFTVGTRVLYPFVETGGAQNQGAVANFGATTWNNPISGVTTWDGSTVM